MYSRKSTMLSFPQDFSGNPTLDWFKFPDKNVSQRDTLGAGMTPRDSQLRI